MALSKSLELFAKDARYDKDTAKVTEDDDKNDTEKNKILKKMYKQSRE